MIFVGEAPAGPAKYGDLDFLERLDHVLANAADVGNVRIFAHPETLIYAAAQVFGKMSVDLRGDPVLAPVDVNEQFADFVTVGGNAGGGPDRAGQPQDNYGECQFLSIHERSPISLSIGCIFDSGSCQVRSKYSLEYVSRFDDNQVLKSFKNGQGEHKCLIFIIRRLLLRLPF